MERKIYWCKFKTKYEKKKPIKWHESFDLCSFREYSTINRNFFPKNKVFFLLHTIMVMCVYVLVDIYTFELNYVWIEIFYKMYRIKTCFLHSIEFGYGLMQKLHFIHMNSNFITGFECAAAFATENCMLCKQIKKRAKWKTKKSARKKSQTEKQTSRTLTLKQCVRRTINTQSRQEWTKMTIRK